LLRCRAVLQQGEDPSARLFRERPTSDFRSAMRPYFPTILLTHKNGRDGSSTSPMTGGLETRPDPTSIWHKPGCGPLSKGCLWCGRQTPEYRRSLTPLAGSSKACPWARRGSWIPACRRTCRPHFLPLTGSCYFSEHFCSCVRQPSYYNTIYSRTWWKRLLSGQIFLLVPSNFVYRQATIGLTLRRKLITKSVVYSRMK
jgi:hypothetical protein